MNRLPDQRLHIHLLGQLTAVQHPAPQSGAADDLTSPLSRKSRAILAYLAAANQPTGRVALQTLFCQQANDPAGSLRWHLSRIRRALGAEILVETGAGLSLNPQLVWVDSHVFAETLSQPSGQANPDEVRRLLALYRGEFLAGLTLPDSPEFELWLLGERAYYHRLARQGWHYLAGRAVNDGRYDEAIDWLQTLLQHEPLDEESHAQLIRLYAQTGQRQAALRQYELCAALLQEFLAVAPTAALQTLFREIQDGRIGPHPAKPTLLPAQRRAPPTTFVGRQAELTRLEALAEQAGQGQGSVLLLSAPAGGGKTRLVQEFAARNPDLIWLSGRCYESTRHLPYHPWLEILAGQLNRVDDSHLAQFPRFWLKQLAWLLPPLATRLQLAVTQPPAASEAEQLFLAITHLLLAGAAARLPRLIFVDDLQWADEASLHLFHFLALRLTERPFLLIAAYRREDATETAGLASLLHDLRRAALPLTHLDLSPLPPDTIADLTAQRWSRLPPGYRPHVVELLAQATGGNPFFLVELLHELASSDDLPTQLPVPPSVRELVNRRLQQLPPDSRQVIEALAIWDAPATLDQVQQISSRSETETVAAVDLGLTRGLLKSVAGHTPTGYAFAHDLVGQAVMAQLSQVRRQLLHRRCANLLMQTAARLSPTEREQLAGRIAHHAWQGEELALVWQWAIPAAQHAQKLYAYHTALAFYEMATATFTAESASPTQWRALIDCHLNRILLGVAAGRPLPEQEALMQQTADWLAQYPDKRQQAFFHLCQATVWTGAGTYDQAVAAAERGYAAYQQLGDLPLAARCLAQAGEAKIRLSQNRAGRRFLAEALALYEAAADIEGISRCRSSLAWAALNLGEVAVALDHLQQALAVNQAQHDRLGEARIAYTLAAAWLYCYHAANVRRYARQAGDLFHQMGYKTMVTRTLIYEGLATRIEGDWEAAAAIFSQVLDAATAAAADLWLEGWTAQALGRIRLRQGDLAEAERLFQHARSLRQQSGETQNLVSDLAWLGRLRLAQGRPAEALTETAAAIRHIEAAQGEYYVWETPDVYLCHAEALLANGRAAEAQTAIQTAYDVLQQFAAQIGDTAVKESFLAHWTSARIIEANETGEIRPFAPTNA
jgi:DNA-binding SARP family transcriptional activator